MEICEYIWQGVHAITPCPSSPLGNSQSVDHMDLLLVSGNNGKRKYLKIIQT